MGPHESDQHGTTSIDQRRAELSGMRARRRLRDVPEVRRKGLVERSPDLGLESARSIIDRNLSLFSRGPDPMFAGIQHFLKSPYVENVRDIGGCDVAVLGAPLDMRTTYRSGTRFCPQAVRKISALYDSYSPDFGMDLLEEITVGDIGDIFVIPTNGVADGVVATDDHGEAPPINCRGARAGHSGLCLRAHGEHLPFCRSPE